MKLRELDGQLVRCLTPTSFRTDVESVGEAQGVLFLCPACWRRNGGPAGTHSILVWFEGRGVPDEVEPVARWQAIGNSIDDLSLHPSVNGDCWHGWVRDGAAA
ncbi:MAG TPA: hypothetical protein VLI71_09870 [Gammaproteobacteria bacterium]|nr:hypothetical protein [Gammaproteobacteria bacterium]